MNTQQMTINNDVSPQPPEHIADSEVLEAYYDDGSKDYIIRAPNGDYTRLNEGGLKLQLKKRGYSSTAISPDDLSEVQERVAGIQMHQCVKYAAPLAGYHAGIYEFSGRKVLVTDSPRVIQPLAGDRDIVTAFVENLLGDQVDYFWGWLKLAYECLLTRNHRPGHALVLAGERDCGKSLLQKLITEILGGRMAKPYSHMSGSTQFNKHMFMAEHLVIDDEVASTNLQQRRAFGSQLKQITGQLTQQCHGKHQTPITLSPLWRLTVSLNEEPENMLVLPPLDPDIEDKIILLKAYRHDPPMPTTTHGEREAYWLKLVSELPALLYDLTEWWEIPGEMQGGRFGLRHFHDPELVVALRQLSPEEQLLTLIDATYFSTDRAELTEVRSEEMATYLKEGNYGHEARQLLGFFRAAGTYLGRLAKTHPDRVQQHRVRGTSLWRLLPPNYDEE